MIFKSIFLALLLVVCHRVADSAPAYGSDESPSQLLERLLESLTKDLNPMKSWYIREPVAQESQATEPRVRPVPAPPPGPALGDVVSPVAWPYPPAPQTSGSEFPLLERFLKSSGISSNVQNNQISVQTPNQWSESFPERKPAASPPSIQWSVQQNPVSAPAPQTPQTQYNEWVVPSQKASPVLSPLTSQGLPPPLNPEENYYIQHTPQNRGQPKRFSLETIRMSEPQIENRDKLNVSFILPPDVRPLSLNFDTGEVQIDFGDQKGKTLSMEKIPTQSYNQKIPTLDEIFRAQGQSTGSSGTGKANIQETDDGEYIVVRHDMNRYAYDLPKGGNVGSSAASEVNTATQAAGTPTVEKYDVSGQKNLHFTLGRVSG